MLPRVNKGDYGSQSGITSQILCFPICMSTLQTQFLQIFTLVEVFKKVLFSDLKCLRVDERPKCNATAIQSVLEEVFVFTNTTL